MGTRREALIHKDRVSSGKNSYPFQGDPEMKQRNSDRRRISFAIVALTCSLHSLASGQAQTSPQIVHGFNQVAISPNANYVAWVEPLLADNGESTGHSAIYVQDLKTPGATPKRISATSGGANAAEED